MMQIFELDPQFIRESLFGIISGTKARTQQSAMTLEIAAVLGVKYHLLMWQLVIDGVYCVLTSEI